MSAPDLIVISTQHEEHVLADCAELLVTVKGSTLVTGRPALRKNREVQSLVEGLVRFGLVPEDIGLESIHAGGESEALGPSSHATYRLRIRCINVGILPDVLEAVSTSPHARLDDVQWRYPDSASRMSAWLEACLAKANAKAKAAADALRIEIVGVHRMVEQPLAETHDGAGEHVVRVERPSGAGADAAMRAVGFNLTHQKRAGIRVTVEYRVSRREQRA